jgi:membrane protein YdbS with pleckstrin-like domain
MTTATTHTTPTAPTRHRAAEWVYRGIWGVLATYFRVPEHPPSLPIAPTETLQSFKPADGFLRYLKFIFWFWLTIIDGALLIGWLILTIALPLAGLITAPLFLALAILPDIVAYIAIHLRYDTTWYLLSPRSLRIRRGIWTIHETTITFENIQNVEISQGPVQRYFGIASLVVKTAGGGGGGGGEHGQGKSAAHRGLIEGIADAPRIRDLILAHAARSRSSGLGDDHERPHAHAARPSRPTPSWTPAHLAALRDIRAHARTLATQS